MTAGGPLLVLKPDDTWEVASGLLGGSTAFAPGAPLNARATSTVSGQVDVTWDPPASDGGSAITGYTATATRVGGGTPQTTSVGATARGASIIGLTAGSQYSVTVHAVNAIGPGPESSPPSTVVVAGGSSGGTLTLTWGPMGKNGGRWLRNTPGWAENVPNVIEVDPTWSAIGGALQSLTDSQVAAKSVIEVRPGALPGNGGGSTSTPVLQGLGSATWAERVLIRPRDGYGTVTIGASRIFRVHGVSWAGFVTSSFRIDSCLNAGQAWFKVNGQANWATTAGEPVMTGLHVVEVVVPANFTGSSDVSDCWPHDGVNIESPLFEGLFLGPAFRASGSSAHVDTLQFEGINGGVVNNAVMRDCVAFGSKNTCIEISALRTPLFDHCYLVAQPYQTGRYPYPSGSDTGTNAWTFNGGSGTPAATIRDSVTIGQWKVTGTNPIAVVSNVIANFDYSATYPGTYTVYPGLTDGNFNAQTGLSRPGIPDVDYRLADIWTA